MSLYDMASPDTAAAVAANQVARRYYSSALYAHGVRSYLWGVAYAERAGLDVDLELFYVAALLHDVGLTQPFDAHQMPFEEAGGQLAWVFAAAAGWPDERRTRVAQVIERHMWRRHPRRPPDVRQRPARHHLRRQPGPRRDPRRLRGVPRRPREGVRAAVPRPRSRPARHRPRSSRGPHRRPRRIANHRLRAALMTSPSGPRLQIRKSAAPGSTERGHTQLARPMASRPGEAPRHRSVGDVR